MFVDDFKGKFSGIPKTKELNKAVNIEKKLVYDEEKKIKKIEKDEKSMNKEDTNTSFYKEETETKATDEEDEGKNYVKRKVIKKVYRKVRLNVCKEKNLNVFPIGKQEIIEIIDEEGFHKGSDFQNFENLKKVYYKNNKIQEKDIKNMYFLDSEKKDCFIPTFLENNKNYEFSQPFLTENLKKDDFSNHYIIENTKNSEFSTQFSIETKNPEFSGNFINDYSSNIPKQDSTKSSFPLQPVQNISQLSPIQSIQTSSFTSNDLNPGFTQTKENNPSQSLNTITDSSNNPFLNTNIVSTTKIPYVFGKTQENAFTTPSENPFFNTTQDHSIENQDSLHINHISCDVEMEINDNCPLSEEKPISPNQYNNTFSSSAGLLNTNPVFSTNTINTPNQEGVIFASKNPSELFSTPFSSTVSN